MVDLKPFLLKPQANGTSQVLVHGEALLLSQVKVDKLDLKNESMEDKTVPTI
jgi:cobyric acid synthase